MTEVDTAPQGSTRKRAKERLERVSKNLRTACLILSDVHQVYAPREKALGLACSELIKIVSMAEQMTIDLRSHF